MIGLEIPFELVAGHVICEIDCERVLMDTGSPVSFGRASRFTLLEAPFTLEPRPLGVTVEAIVDGVRSLPRAPADLDLDVLLGMDLLHGHGLSIHPAARRLVITTLSERATAAARPPDRLVPRVEVALGERAVQAFLDTGAPISYFVPEILAEAPHAGSAPDFHPFLGRWEAELRRIPLRLLSREVQIDAAIAPPALAQHLRAAHAEGIIGMDAISQLEVVHVGPGGPSGPLGTEPLRFRPPRLLVGPEYPYVVVRYMPTVYGKRKVDFGAAGKRARNELRFSVPVIGGNGPARPPPAGAAAALVEQVVAEARRSRLPMCVVLSPNRCVHIAADGSQSDSTAVPEGGVRIDRVQTLHSLGAL